MKIRLIVIGKTEDSYLKTGIAEYVSRIGRYVKFSLDEIPGLKNTLNLTRPVWKAKEAEKISQVLNSSDLVILLDEKGKQFGSVEFAGFLNQQFSGSSKNLTFIIGGPYGFDETLRARAGYTISLSRMTFSHQMVRLIFVEQLYRAMTILKNESYHHE